MDRERAKAARDSFLEYFKLIGRTMAGERLIFDNEILVTAREAERAFWAGKNFFDEQGRGTVKSIIGVHFHAWLIAKFPGMTVGHFSVNDTHAFDRNTWVQDVLRQPEHKAVFGRDGTLDEGNSNQRQTTVLGNPRRASSPNITAKGIEGARAGPHYDRLWFDDVVDENNTLVAPAKLQVVLSKFRLTIKKMLVDWRTLGHAVGKTGVGLFWYSGTPYTETDLHAVLREQALRGAAQISGNMVVGVCENAAFVYRCLWFGGPDTDFYTPIPLILSKEFLAEQYAENERAYELSYMGKALGAGEKPFVRQHYWIHERYTQHPKWPETLASLGFCPRVLPTSEYNSKTRTWPRVMTVDPGFSEKKGSSYTGYCIGTVAPDGTIFILYANQFRKAWDEGRHELVDRAKHWQVDRVLIEAAAQQDALRSYFMDEKLYCSPISHGGHSKLVRANDVAGDVNSGRVVLPGSATPSKESGVVTYSIGPPDTFGTVKAKTDPKFKAKYGQKTSTCGDIQSLVVQMNGFPGLQHCDLLDAFVYCVQALRQGGRPRDPDPDPPPKSWVQRAVRAYLEAHEAVEPEEQQSADYEVYANVEEGSWN